MKHLRLTFLLIFLVGAGIRTAGLLRPLNTTSWREPDICSLARNYYREGMNLFYPQIDWRGTGPGYAEMELPLYPWTMAGLYQLFGIHEEFGRLLAYLFSLTAFAVFMLLARHLLPDAGAAIASLFYALNPLGTFVATAIQPESLMLMWYVIAAYAFIRWVDDRAMKYYWLAMLATAMMILAKAPAAHIGLFFGILLFARRGLAALSDWRVWLFGLGALLPGVLWYWHAHNLWLTWGNSLGVSNEYHWAGADLFTNSYFIKGIIKQELEHVWVFLGIVPAAVSLLSGLRQKTVQYSVAWLLAIGCYYLLAARTTADTWAFYYHIPALIPASLLIGASFVAVTQGRLTGNLARVAKWGLVTLLSVTFYYEFRQSQEMRHSNETPMYHCAQELKAQMKEAGLILASGGPCQDADGYPVAWNASYFFYWLDRRGFNICEQRQSISAVEAVAARGARYFVAEKQALQKKSGFEAELRQTWPVVYECNDVLLFQLVKPNG